MKNRIGSLLLCGLIILGSSLSCFAGKIYYFSSTGGDDSRTSTQAQSSSTPWKTLTKLNSFFSSLAAGDQVLFKRGDTFYGTITVTKSGSAGAPITFGAYGTGAKPIITGFSTISTWTSIGSGLYEAVTPAGLSTLNMVVMDGAFQAIGRWPKLSATNSGYLALQSHSGTTSITSNAISGASSFVGGQIVLRAARWVIQRGTISSQSSTTVNFTSETPPQGSAYQATNGYGFFFQNHPKACTSLGEWAYNSSSKKITMYFGSAPGSRVIKVSSVDKLVTLSSRSYITFTDLAFSGANTDVFNILSSNNIILNALDVSFSGQNVVNANNSGSSKITVSNCNVTSTNNNVVSARSSTYWTITGNTITNTAVIAGMGASGDGQYMAVSYLGSNSLVQYNKVTNTGYTGVEFFGSNVIVDKNLFDGFCLVKDDGGAIYTFQTNGSGNKVTNNICLNGKGAFPGITSTYPGANGIYMDNSSTGVEIYGNTVANSTIGIHLHNCTNINFHDNTIYNTQWQIRLNNDGNTTSGLSNNNNIAFSRTKTQNVVFSNTTSVSSLFTSANNNYYCRPLSETGSFNLNSSMTNLAGWKTSTGKETSSKTSPMALTDTNKIRFEYNASTSNKTVSLGATYVDVKGKSYAGSITLTPYTSAVLLYSSASTARLMTDTTVQIVEETTLGIDKPALTVYPNPVKDNFALQIKNNHIGKMSIQLLDQGGALIRTFSYNKEQLIGQVNLQANNLPAGVYFVHVQIGEWSDKKRIIKL